MPFLNRVFSGFKNLFCFLKEVRILRNGDKKCWDKHVTGGHGVFLMYQDKLTVKYQIFI